MKLKHLISNTRTRCAALVAMGVLAGGMTASAQSKYNAAQQAEAAKGVIERFIGSGSGLTVNVSIDLEKDSSGKDKFSYNYSGGTLTVRASSGVAACRGFYDFVKSNGAGISSWSGKRFKMPTTVEHATKEFTSPYRDHQYLNVVTYGYSMPYWDEDRWMKELDWMALHGIDMPLMLLASESIYRDVFAAKGLSQSQIDEWEVGPAHLPWFRMGNLAGNSFDGPLGQNWHNRQKALAKAVLKRMGELGMKPVVPAFGGFVPKAYAEKLGSGNYVASGWGWMPQAYRNYRITPARSEFKEIGKNFIERWDAEFEDSYGTFQYYLSDSFNEMDVPSDLNLLASYGNQIYNAIKEGSNNNEAVWVTQGWEFVYGRSKWNASKYQALRRDVPAHHFMSLYMAPEYGGYQWNYYNNFYGDDWNYTMLPNMGGKNFWTGNLNDYAKSYPQALANGGAYSNCTGWGMTMEGIEYNELLYELISDMGWTNPTQGPDVQAWMEQYGANRYGSDVYDDEFKALHTALRNTVYSSYKDHQNFGWQGNNKSEGYYNAGNIDKTNDTFYAGFDRFFSSDNIAALKAKVQNGAALGETLRADLLEFAAFYAAARVEKICARIKVYNNMGKKDEANALIAELQNVMYDMDYALTGHPLYDEAKWEAKAEKMAETDQTETNHYVKNARRIVTTWYGEHGGHEAVNDYASRIYAGIIRDYYMPRLVAELNNLVNGQNNNLRQVELNFIPNKSGAAQVNALSVPKHVVDGKLVEVPGGMTLQNTPDDVLLDFVAKLVDDSREVGTLTVAKEKIVPSTDSKTQWYVISSNYDNYRDRVITVSGNASDKSATYGMQTVSGSKNQYWRFISTGDNTYRIESREGQVLSYDNGFKTYKYNINSDTQWDYNSDEVIYAFKPATASNWLHYADASKGFEFYGYKDNSGWFPGSTFTLETVNLSDDIVSETDYTRYRSRLEGYNTWFPGEYGQAGLPKSADALSSTIAGFNKANNAGALTSITNFLEENWPTALNTAVDVPEEGTKARLLFDLMLGALDLPEGPDANAITTFRTALHSAQAAIASGNESNCATQYTALQSAVKAYMNTVPNFPYASKAPQGGKFYEGSKVITMRCGNGNGYVTMNAMENDAFKLGNTTKPTTSAGYWVVSGDDANGYTFYNVQAGAGKVLGISGSGADARAKLYDANSVPSGVSYKFKYRLNANGAPVFYTGNNNAWNNRDGWLALWDSANAFGTDKGSGFTCEVVANADLGQTVGGETTPTGPTNTDWTDANWTTAAFGDANAASSKTNFYGACYYDFDNVEVATDGTVSATVTYQGGSHAQGFFGIELISKDAPAASNARAHRAPSAANALDDYEFASVGTNGTKTYTVSGVPAGTYTVRVWSAATKGTETMTANGTLVVKSGETQVGSTYNWNNTSWKIDNSLIPERVKTDVNIVKVGVNLNQGNGATRSYRYLDQEMTFDKATTLTTTVTSNDASKTMELIGIELLDQNGNLVSAEGSYDGHYGIIGATTADNTYSLAIPAAGTYTVRVWASYVKNEVASAGTTNYTVPEEEKPYAFPLNFEYDRANTRSDRNLRSISLQVEGAEAQTFTVDPAKIYSNLTETAVFTCAPGDKLTANVGGEVNWMNAYFYIDLDHDKTLKVNSGQLDQTGTELLSYSFWTGSDAQDETGGQNSAGTALSGQQRNTRVLPPFTAPTEPGTYNVRFKLDWNSIDPAGDINSANNDIFGNGGYIVDAVLKVVAASADAAKAEYDAAMKSIEDFIEENGENAEAQDLIGNLYEEVIGATMEISAKEFDEQEVTAAEYKAATAALIQILDEAREALQDLLHPVANGLRLPIASGVYEIQNAITFEKRGYLVDYTGYTDGPSLAECQYPGYTNSHPTVRNKEGETCSYWYVHEKNGQYYIISLSSLQEGKLRFLNPSGDKSASTYSEQPVALTIVESSRTFTVDGDNRQFKYMLIANAATPDYVLSAACGTRSVEGAVKTDDNKEDGGAPWKFIWTSLVPTETAPTALRTNAIRTIEADATIDRIVDYIEKAKDAKALKEDIDLLRDIILKK